MFSVSAESDSRCPVRPKGNFIGDSVVCDHNTTVRVTHFNDSGFAPPVAQELVGLFQRVTPKEICYVTHTD